MSWMAVVACSLASLQYRDRAGRVFDEQADIACPTRAAPRGVGPVTRRVSAPSYLESRGGAVLDVMDSRSRMSIDPGVTCRSGANHARTHRPG